MAFKFNPFTGKFDLQETDHGNLAGLTDDDHVRYFDKDGSKVATGNFDLNYNQLLRSAIHKGTIANLPNTGNEVEGQQYLATDICTLFLFCNSTWQAQQSFAAVTLYVDKTNGADTIGKGYASGTGAVATIQKAIDLIPSLNGGNVTVNITGETYNESPVIQSKAFSGNFSITLQGTLSQQTSGTVSSGTAGSGATRGTLTHTGAGWTVDEHVGKLVFVNGVYRLIHSNTVDTLTIVWNFGSTPTGTYIIYNWGTSIDGGGTQNTNFTISDGQKAIILNDIEFTNYKSGPQMQLGAFSGSIINRCKFKATSASGAFSTQIFSFLCSTSISTCLFEPFDTQRGLVTNANVRAAVYNSLFLQTSNQSIRNESGSYLVIQQGTNIKHSGPSGWGIYLLLNSSIAMTNGYNHFENCSTGIQSLNGSQVIGTVNNIYTGCTTNENAVAASYGYID